MMKRLLVFLLVMTSHTAFGGMVDNYGTGSRATALGGAFSARADDPFAVYYNPAGLARIEKPMISAGALVVSPDMTVYDYKVEGGISTQDPRLQAPRDFDNKTKRLVSPHLGFAMPVSDRFSFGVAAYAPFGMEIEWEDDLSTTPGAYNSYHSYYVREVVSPSLAYRISDRVSIGGGVSLGRSKSGNDCFGASFGGLKNEASLEDDFNYSFNLGIMVLPTDRLTLGLTYRGRTETDFEGDLEVAGMGKVAKVELDYDHPEQVQAGICYLAGKNKTLSLEMDVVWTNWSINSAQDQHLTFKEGIYQAVHLPKNWNENIPRDWEDTTQFRFGAEWQALDYLALRLGYFYDPTPVPDSSMDFIWPDADKQTWSFGAGFEFGNYTLDSVFSYSKTDGKRHIDGESESLNHSNANPMDPTSPALASFNAEGEVWSYGMTLSYHF
ncbi:MAG: long-chain fatty acid transporter [Desulfobacteraceae bacterium]|nr:long-chain fatty acid transporter [Desulfobacteraceae bacterium]